MPNSVLMKARLISQLSNYFTEQQLKLESKSSIAIINCQHIPQQGFPPDGYRSYQTVHVV